MNKFYIDSKDDLRILITNTSDKLGIGSLAAWTPAVEVGIEPIIAQAYPNVFKEKAYIRTVSPERTFWEKATILHHEANRPKNSLMPLRYARHYYDLYKIAISPVRESALSDKELLKKVTEFKIKFYPRKWAKYEEALTGELKLLPEKYRLKEMQKDYEDMKEMIYKDPPEFDELIKEIEKLEKEANSF